MRIAYLDCFSGISGDMFLGALIDAGVSPKLLEDTVAALDIGARLEISQVDAGRNFGDQSRCATPTAKKICREKFSGSSRSSHDHAHETLQSRRSRTHSHEHQPRPHHGRTLTDIRKIIEKAAISSTAKATAIKIFEALGQAEAEIHNTSIDQVHFHEVGAVDAMVDIVCAAVERNLLRSKNGYAPR